MIDKRSKIHLACEESSVNMWTKAMFTAGDPDLIIHLHRLQIYLDICTNQYSNKGNFHNWWSRLDYRGEHLPRLQCIFIYAYKQTHAQIFTQINILAKTILSASNAHLIIEMNICTTNPVTEGGVFFGSFAHLDPNSDKQGGHIGGELLGHFEANQ